MSRTFWTFLIGWLLAVVCVILCTNQVSDYGVVRKRGTDRP